MVLGVCAWRGSALSLHIIGLKVATIGNACLEAARSTRRTHLMLSVEAKVS